MCACVDALQGRHAFLLSPPHERLLNVERSYHYVRAVIPAMSSKPLGIYPHVCVSTRSEIGPHILRHLQTSQHRRTVCSDGCFSILDHASTTIQKSKKLFTFNGSNLHLTINCIMLIQNFPRNCIPCFVSIVCFVQWAFCYTLQIRLCINQNRRQQKNCRNIIEKNVTYFLICYH